MNYKLGDNVEYISFSSYDGANLHGMRGIIVNLESDRDFEGGERIGIEFENEVRSEDDDGLIVGHSCHGKGEEGFCYNVPIHRIKLLNKLTQSQKLLRNNKL